MKTIILSAESALVNRIKENTSLARVNIYEGHAAGEKNLPCIVVNAESSNERDDLPPGSGIFDIKISVSVLIQADDESEEEHDEIMSQVMNQIEENKERNQALDKAAGIHFYAIHFGEDKASREDRHWIHSISLDAVAQSV